MNNINYTRRQSQEWMIKSAQPTAFNEYHLIEQVQKLRPTYQRVFNALQLLANNCFDIFPSQKTLASLAQVSIRTVHTVLRYFEKQGWIITNYRHMTSKQYKVASVFFVRFIRQQLRAYIWAFMYIPLAYVSFAHSIALSKHFADNIRKDIYIYYGNNTVNPLRREAGSTQDILSKKREHVMSNQVQPISSYVLGELTTRFRLTKAGQIYLSAFDDNALSGALDKLQAFPAAREPYRYFIAKAQEISRQHSLEVDWNYARALRLHFEVHEDEPHQNPPDLKKSQDPHSSIYPQSPAVAHLANLSQDNPYAYEPVQAVKKNAPREKFHKRDEPVRRPKEDYPNLEYGKWVNVNGQRMRRVKCYMPEETLEQQIAKAQRTSRLGLYKYPDMVIRDNLVRKERGDIKPYETMYWILEWKLYDKESDITGHQALSSVLGNIFK